jgi:hypothetical protein
VDVARFYPLSVLDEVPNHLGGFDVQPLSQVPFLGHLAFSRIRFAFTRADLGSKDASEQFLLPRRIVGAIGRGKEGELVCSLNLWKKRRPSYVVVRDAGCTRNPQAPARLADTDLP